MENWQQEQIIKNLSQLLLWTTCDIRLLSILEQESVIGDIDIEIIMRGRTVQDKNVSLYNILLTRRNGYYKLIKALNGTNQTYAAKLLLVFPAEKFQHLQLSFLGQIYKANVLGTHKLRNILAWLQANVSAEERLEIHKYLFNPESALELVRCTAPAPHLPYISRTLFRKTVINPNLFKIRCSDVFIFKGLQVSQLRKFGIMQQIHSSSNQLAQMAITAQFILLDHETHWKLICAKVKNPVHLIVHDVISGALMIERTSGSSVVLHHYLQQPNLDKTLTEDELIQMTLANNVSSVGICDSPGMGKSLLLASLARKAYVLCPDRIAVYIRLRDFAFSTPLSKGFPRLAILRHISTCSFAYRILLELTQQEHIRFVLFFDGLDEVEENILNQILQFLQTIPTAMPGSTIFVTSRLVLRSKLHETLGVIAYGIEPYNVENQCKFLSDSWALMAFDLCNYRLQEYAKHILENMQAQLSEGDRNITGIPILCKFIADIYANEAAKYADRNIGASVINFTVNAANSIFEICSKFMERQIGKTQCDFECMHNLSFIGTGCNILCNIRSYHVWQALRLVCSSPIDNIKLHVNRFENLSNHNIFSPGLLIQASQQYTLSVTFLHTIFAEYLVAEYFSAIFSKPPTTSFSGILVRSYVENLGFGEVFAADDTGSFPDCSLRRNGLAYFLNTLITRKQQFQVYVYNANVSSSSIDFFRSLVGCLRYNYEALFQIFIQATFISSKSAILYLQQFMHKYKDIAIQVFKAAVKYCSVRLIEILCDFSLKCFNFDFLRLCSEDPSCCVPVHTAIRRADIDVVRYLVDRISLQNKGLLYCCLKDTYSEDEELVEKRLNIAQFLLCKYYCLLSETWERYKSPLFAPNLHLQAVKFLIDRGANFRQRDERGLTILHHASIYMTQMEFLDLSRFLYHKHFAWDLFGAKEWINFFGELERKENLFGVKRLANLLYILFRKDTLIFETKVSGKGFSETETDTCILDILSSPLGSTFYQQFEAGFKTLFCMAVKEGNTAVVDLLVSCDKLLLELECEDKQTPLLLAVSNGHLKTVINLVSRGANIFSVNNQGETILHIAAKSGNAKFFQQILNITENIPSNTKHNQIKKENQRCQKEPTNLIELFWWKERTNMQTPLHYAMRFISLPVQTLYSFLTLADELAFKLQSNYVAKVGINEIDLHEKTALLHALESRQNLDVVNYLIQYGAFWNIKNSFGCNLTHLSAQLQLVEHLKYFVSLGCDINELDCHGNDALHCTFSQYYDGQSVGKLSEIIQLLIAAGASKERQNKQGYKAIHIATKRKFPLEICSLLAYKEFPSKLFEHMQ